MSEPTDSELKRLEEELRPHLAQILTRSPKAEETRALIDRLQPAFDRISMQDKKATLPFPKRTPPSLWRLLLSQFAIYPRGFWTMGLLLFAMLTYFQSIIPAPSFNESDLFSLSLPLFLILGNAYGFRSANREMRMVERITPYPPTLIFLSRLLILLGISLIFGLMGNLWLILTSKGSPYPSFFPGWIAPMLLTGGMLAYAIFRWGTTAGYALSLLSWGFWIGAKGWLIQKERPIWEANGWWIHLGVAGIGILLLYLTYRRLIRYPLEGERHIL